jgi:hypothetical protein
VKIRGFIFMLLSPTPEAEPQRIRLIKLISV